MGEKNNKILHISGIRHMLLDDIYFYRKDVKNIDDFLLIGSDEIRQFDNYSDYNFVLFHFIETLEIISLLEIISENKNIKFGLYLHSFFPFASDGTFLNNQYNMDDKYMDFIKNLDFVIAQDYYSVRFLEPILKQNNNYKFNIFEIKQPVNITNVIAHKKHSEYFRLGFIGSFSSIKGFDFLKGFLIKYGKIFNKNSIVINFFTLENPGKNIWNENSEIKVKKYKNGCIYYNSYDRRDIYSEIDCLLIPSIWNETGPMVLYESFANKIPVIVSDRESLIEKVLDKTDSYVYKTGDEKELLKAILWMKENYNTVISNEKGYKYITIEEFNIKLTNKLNEL